MKQYKDELLASCLNFLLSLPHDIIMLDITAYIPALQVGPSDVQLKLFFFPETQEFWSKVSIPLSKNDNC